MAAARGAMGAREIEPIDPLAGLRKVGTPGHTMMYEVDATCAAISRGAKRVVFKGNGAYTDNVTIVLPAMTPTALYEHQACLVLRGYANHEASHCRYTDWGALRDGLEGAAALVADPVLGRKVRGIYKTVSNIVEDCFIEGRLPIEFPGTRQNLDATRGHVVARAHADIDQHRGLPAVPAFYSALLYRCNVVNGWASQAQSEAILATIAEDNGPLVALVERWVPAIAAIATSRESHEVSLGLTKAFVEMMRDPDAEEPEEGDGGAGGGARGEDGEREGEEGRDQAGGQGGERGRDDPGDRGRGEEGGGAGGEDEPGGDGSDKAGSGKDGSDKDGSDERGSDKRGSGKGGSGKGGSKTEERGDPSKPGGATGGEPRDAGGLSDEDLAKALGEVGDDAPQGRLDVSDLAREVGKETKEAIEAIKKAYGQGAANEAMKGTDVVRHDPPPGTTPPRGPTDPRVARAIRTLAMSTARRRVTRNRDDGDFDAANVMSQALGTGDFYKRVRDKPQVATAMVYLVDQSGSMGGLMEAVAGMTASAAEASYGIPGLKTAALSFTSRRAQDGARLCVHVLKDFGDAPARARAALDSWRADMGSMGGTPTADALMEAGRLLDARREQRRIVVLVTDGQPDNVEAALAAQGHLKRRGISVCLIEIGGHATSRMRFDVSVVARREEDLPQALEEIAKVAFGRKG